MIVFMFIVLIGVLDRFSMVGEVVVVGTLIAIFAISFLFVTQEEEIPTNKDDVLRYKNYVDTFFSVVPRPIKWLAIASIFCTFMVPQSVYLYAAGGTLAGMSVLSSEHVSPLVEKASDLLEAKMDELIDELQPEEAK